MNLKKTIVVALVVAATASAAFLARREMVGLRAEREMTRREVVTLSTAAVARPAPAASLTIDGTVIGSAPTSGTLTLHVGSAVSIQPITVSPEYSFAMTGAQGTDMVSIEIETPTYRFASLLGSYAKLVRQAGGDAHLTAAECDRVRVSPFSTSMYFFIQRELGGRMPLSDAEHEWAVRSLSGDDIPTAAAWLDDLAQGRVALPNGFANGYALLQDQQAYRAFLAQNNGYARTSSLMSAPSVPIRSGRLGRNTLLLGQIPLHEITMFDPGVRILSQTAAGWTSHTSASRRNSLFTASFPASGELVLTAKGNVSSDVDLAASPVPFEHYVILRETYRQLFVGERYSLWGVTDEWVATHPQDPAQPPTAGSNTGMFVASNIDGVLPFRDGELPGERTLPVLCKRGPLGYPPRLENCESALQRFSADGTGYSDNVGPKVDANGQPFGANGSENFQWSISRTGPLEMTYPDATVTYWRIARANAAVNTLVYVARSKDGPDTLTTAGLAAMVNADLPGDFADLGPVGTWRYGSFDAYTAAYGYDPEYPPQTTMFQRNADGTTARTDTIQYDPPDGPYQFTIRYGWQMLAGRLYETRYRANVSTGIPGTVGFSNCQSAYARGATQCAPQQIRYFRPLAKVDNRLYGLQEIYQQTSSYTPPYTWLRAVTPNYLEKQ